MEERKIIWQTVSREIELFLTAKSRCSSGNNPAAEQKLRHHILNIQSMIKERAELSAVAKWCLSFRNEPQLLRLAA